MALGTAAELGIEQVAEGIAQHVEPEDGQADGDAGEHGHPRGLEHVAEPLSMAPHDGVGGGTPNPRKLRADSARIATPSPKVTTTMIGAAILGRMWRAMICQSWHPMARATSMYWFSRMARTALRMIRALPAVPPIPRARITLPSPWPSMAMALPTI